jgi:hypothetical protein
MAKAKKAGKPKRNSRNFSKNLKRISNNVKVLKEIKESK